MCLKSKSSRVCPICYEEKKLTTQCKICSDTRICNDCCLSLCEKGLCGRCPVCRQPNWKKPRKSQIMPILFKVKTKAPSKTEEIHQQHEYTLPPLQRHRPVNCIFEYIRCKERIFNIMVFLAACLLVYLAGLFTIFIFVGEDYIKDKLWPFWFAPLIGLLWVGLIWTPCCCGTTLRNMYCRREIY